MAVRAGLGGLTGLQNQSSALLIKNSLRFGGSSYLSRTPGSAGNRRTSTFSVWFKWVSQGGEGVFLWANGRTKLAIDPGGNDALSLDDYDGSYNLRKLTTQSLRDPSAWYHLVVVMDTTNATAGDRQRLYLNGERITAFSTSTDSGQNFDTDWNNSVEHRIGADNNPFYFRGYMAECHMIDGTALDPSYFGFTDPLTNTWRPKKVEGVTYGTNGFYLDFSDSSNLGADRSGNGNNFTPNNFENVDVVKDSPSGITLGTSGSTNQPSDYCTLNPLDEGEFGGGLTVSDGNLKCVSTASDRHVRSTFFLPTSGKWYWEMIAPTINTAGYLATGLYHATGSLTSTAIATAQGRWYAAEGYGNGSSWGATYDDGDLIGIAVDMDAGKIWAHKNGIYQGSGNPITGANPMYSDLRTAYSTIEWSPVCANWQTGNTATFNFGQQPFVYPPGSSTSATPYFKSITYTGNGAENAITGLGFQPDFVWSKRRDNVSDHHLFDVVRGVTKGIFSNDQKVEETNAQFLKSFDSDGFTLGTNGGLNADGGEFQAWCWKAGGTASSNTDGSITSSVSVNQTAGFSIVTWTGSNADGTVGHGLDTIPGLIIFKRRNNVTSWPVYTSVLGASHMLQLNETSAKASTSGGAFGSTPTAPTSTVFSVGNNGGTNYGDMVAYCFAPKTGITSIGSYEGNGSIADGVTVDVGFKPAMVIIKNADAVDDWNIIDNNKPREALRPNSSSAEDASAACHLTPTGFRVTTGNSHRINYANETFVYIAFAENYSDPKDIDEFKSLCTANLPTPTSSAAVRPDKYFNTILYTGNGGTKNVSGTGFKPDLVWIKDRDASNFHCINDTVRGAGNYLSSNTNNGENDANGVVTSLDPDGFSLGFQGIVNDNNVDYVAWCWKAGGDSSTFNIDGVGYATASAAGLDGGTITPTGASVNTEAGFSILQFTGTGAAATLAHGLNDDVKFILIKRTNVSGNSWAVYHDAVGPDKQFLLNSTIGATTADTNGFDNAPSSGLIRLGSGAAMDTNQVGAHICYAWSEVAGFSKFGSFEANGNSDGPFVYLGFKPAFLLCKNIDATEAWLMKDSSRQPTNPNEGFLLASSSAAENFSVGNDVDFLSNGFKIRTTNNPNTSGSTYVFAAFAETPTNNLFGGQANAQ